MNIFKSIHREFYNRKIIYWIYFILTFVGFRSFRTYHLYLRLQKKSKCYENFLKEKRCVPFKTSKNTHYLSQMKAKDYIYLLEAWLHLIAIDLIFSQDGKYSYIFNLAVLLGWFRYYEYMYIVHCCINVILVNTCNLFFTATLIYICV